MTGQPVPSPGTFELALSYIPVGWKLSHIISLDRGEWEAILISDDYCSVATGSSPYDAIHAAIVKTGAIKYLSALYKPSDHSFDDSKPLVDIQTALRNFTASFSKPLRRRI